MAMNKDEDLEEERRVFHVAVTRARDEIYLVMPQVYRNRGGNLVMMKPSRFLTELAKDLTEPMDRGRPPHLLGGVDRGLCPRPTRHSLRLGPTACRHLSPNRVADLKETALRKLFWRLS
jgi:hypothetical protein